MRGYPNRRLVTKSAKITSNVHILECVRSGETPDVANYSTHHHHAPRPEVVGIIVHQHLESHNFHISVLQHLQKPNQRIKLTWGSFFVNSIWAVTIDTVVLATLQGCFSVLRFSRDFHISAEKHPSAVILFLGYTYSNYICTA